jgi:hypothetical protein
MKLTFVVNINSETLEKTNWQYDNPDFSHIMDRWEFEKELVRIAIYEAKWSVDTNQSIYSYVNYIGTFKTGLFQKKDSESCLHVEFVPEQSFLYSF